MKLCGNWQRSGPPALRAPLLAAVRLTIVSINLLKHISAE